MKKIISYLLIIGLSFACKDDSKNSVENTSTEKESLDLSMYKAMNMAPYQINKDIYLPNDESLIGGAIQPRVEHTEDDFVWGLSAGDNFKMRIEDYGDNEALELYKENLKRYENMYTYEVLEDSANVFLYKKSLKNKDDKSLDHYSYHIVGEFEVEGIHYLISSRKEGYEKPIINTMRATVLKAVQ